MDIRGIISSLKRKTNSDHVHHVMRFRVGRTTNKDINNEDVDVLIFDAGEDSKPEYRFICQVKFDDDREIISGNPRNSIENAISDVPWGALDKNRQYRKE